MGANPLAASDFQLRGGAGGLPMGTLGEAVPDSKVRTVGSECERRFRLKDQELLGYALCYLFFPEFSAVLATSH